MAKHVSNRSVNTWNETAIHPKRLGTPSGSWWATPEAQESRESFKRMIREQEAARMNRSALGNVNNPISANK